MKKHYLVKDAFQQKVHTTNGREALAVANQIVDSFPDQVVTIVIVSDKRVQESKRYNAWIEGDPK